MFEIEKIFCFEGGHSLTFHDGKCKDPHGHSYKIHLVIRKDGLVPSGPKKNMVIDFSDISRIVKPMIAEYLDHKWLNDTLKTDSPTAEFIAKWIFEYLRPQLPELYAVRVCETDTASATYRISLSAQ
jgi:6-pyruvoyltetrahydropterin/6-carboxytetrahydropterin synthase